MTRAEAGGRTLAGEQDVPRRVGLRRPSVTDAGLGQERAVHGRWGREQNCEEMGTVPTAGQCAPSAVQRTKD